MPLLPELVGRISPPAPYEMTTNRVMPEGQAFASLP